MDKKKIRIVKVVYHALASLFLFYLLYLSYLYYVAVMMMKKRPPFHLFLFYLAAVFLFAMAAFHAYDVWWFLYKDGPAPI